MLGQSLCKMVRLSLRVFLIIEITACCQILFRLQTDVAKQCKQVICGTQPFKTPFPGPAGPGPGPSTCYLGGLTPDRMSW